MTNFACAGSVKGTMVPPSDFGTFRGDVRFTPESGHLQRTSACPLLTQADIALCCVAPEPRPLTTPLSSEIASGLSRVFMLPRTSDPPEWRPTRRIACWKAVFRVDLYCITRRLRGVRSLNRGLGLHFQPVPSASWLSSKKTVQSPAPGFGEKYWSLSGLPSHSLELAGGARLTVIFGQVFA